MVATYSTVWYDGDMNIFNTVGDTTGMTLRFIKDTPTMQQHWTVYRSSPWSESELDVIRKYGETHTSGEIASQFLTDRWYTEIVYQRRKLGIKYVRKNLWTDSEMSMLDDYVGLGFPLTTICNIFPNRTRNAIKNKMKRMGL